ncbi:molybdenum cofactor guanylyltransferase [Actinomyces viscosus]|uniref:molybdenum cofactor guanylyltransferase n=1 Tax=Actinomyces viscosus TaxID=1656 RepID=UPI0036F32499
MTAPDRPADRGPRAAGTGSAASAAGTTAPPGGLGPIDVVVLAGGTGRRLDGASKPDVVARGARLLDHVLAGLEQLRGQGLLLGHVCVVAPEEVALPDGILRALEDPPLGGPVAGIAAGLACLSQCEPAAGPAGVLTCDAPSSWRALPALIEALRDGERELDGACARVGDHTQYLLGIYRRRALAAAVAPGGTPLRDVAVRRALGALRVTTLPVPQGVVRDLDTWAEVRAWDSGTPE